MNSNSWLFLIGTVAAESILWLLVPGLAAVLGVVLGLFAIASWRDSAKMQDSSVSNNVDDFQRRVRAGAF
jgi:hypothetical protein